MKKLFIIGGFGSLRILSIVIFSRFFCGFVNSCTLLPKQEKINALNYSI
jgi:hypothetical protein